jgi:hypothetical protein
VVIRELDGDVQARRGVLRPIDEHHDVLQRHAFLLCDHARGYVARFAPVILFMGDNPLKRKQHTPTRAGCTGGTTRGRGRTEMCMRHHRDNLPPRMREAI